MGIRQMALGVRLEGKVQKAICLGAERVCGHRGSQAYISPPTSFGFPTQTTKNWVTEGGVLKMQLKGQKSPVLACAEAVQKSEIM